MDYDRIPQENDSQENGVDSLLEAASVEARRILGAIQAVAGTASCKGVQISGLKKWAQEKGYWIENPDDLGVFSDRGSENEVYMNISQELVYKLNDFRYADDNLIPFFERIFLHNKLFPECLYRLIGFPHIRR